MTNKMKPEIKEQWLEALRSGEYEQTKSVLHRRGDNDGPDGFCCLGVLCDLAYKAGVVERRAENEYDGNVYSYGPEIAIPPAEVLEWAFGTAEAGEGLLSANSDSLEGTPPVWLPKLNDAYSLSFESIARVLEQEDI